MKSLVSPRFKDFKYFFSLQFLFMQFSSCININESNNNDFSRVKCFFCTNSINF